MKALAEVCLGFNAPDLCHFFIQIQYSDKMLEFSYGKFILLILF